MKSKVLENRFFVECMCMDPSDLLVFDIDEDYQYIEVYFTNNYHNGLWWRIRSAFRLIFKPSCEYRNGASIGITKKNIKELEEAILTIKSFKEGQESNEESIILPYTS